jgi:hypothetical protein
MVKEYVGGDHRALLEEALEILRRVVTERTEGRQVVPMLLGTIRGIVERRAGQPPAD